MHASRNVVQIVTSWRRGFICQVLLDGFAWSVKTASFIRLRRTASFPECLWSSARNHKGRLASNGIGFCGSCGRTKGPPDHHTMAAASVATRVSERPSATTHAAFRRGTRTLGRRRRHPGWSCHTALDAAPITEGADAPHGAERHRSLGHPAVTRRGHARAPTSSHRSLLAHETAHAQAQARALTKLGSAAMRLSDPNPAQRWPAALAAATRVRGRPA
jgi:hypothetical protein